MQQPTISVPRTWAKPAPSEPYCAIEALELGAIRTLCRGSWPVSDNHLVHGDPDIDDCCKRCLALVVSTANVQVSDTAFEPVLEFDDFRSEPTVNGRPLTVDCTDAVFGDVDAVIADTFGEAVADRLEQEAFESAETIVLGPKPSVLMDWDMGADADEEWK